MMKNQKNKKQAAQQVVVAIALSMGISVALIGCSSGLGGSNGLGTTAPASNVTLRGNVHGGQQPVANSTIQLYAVGTTGNASAATPLLTSTVLSDVNGNFGITGAYSCPTNSLVYLTANGGDPGIGGGTNNTAIAMMVALGSCAALQANAATAFVTINELTTVAAATAMGGFMQDYNSVGYASGNLSGMTQAMATANILVSSSNGFAPGITSTGVASPTVLIDTLADAVSTCVNTASSSSTYCTAFFTATTPTGGTAPTNVAAALANVAHNPALGTAAIFALVQAAAPFQPNLATAPANFAITLKYTGGGLSLPSAIAIDASGNAWIANQGSSAVTELSGGAFASGTNGYVFSSIFGAQGIAVDASNNVWLANTSANSVVKLNSTGAITQTLTTGIGAPVSIAFDGAGNVWVANFTTSTIAGFTSAGIPLSGSPFSNAALSGPSSIAVDANNTVWVSSSTGNSIVTFSNAGAFNASYTDGLLVAPGGIATDTTNNHIWTAATGINAISSLTSAGVAVSGAPYATGGVSQPISVAVDGAGTVWTANNVTSGSVSAFSKTGVALTGSAGLGSLNQPTGVALDASGNLWVAALGDNSVTEFIGAASPIATPLVASGR